MSARIRPLLALLPLLLAGCTRERDAAPPVPVTAVALEPVRVWKSPTCGCCSMWVAHMRREGFTVEVVDTPDMAPVKARYGVPAGLGSCHTARVGRYTLEGHVPAREVKRLLAERPALAGLAVPGMPVGSPGMEVPGQPAQPYTVVAFGPNGTGAFASYR